MKPASSPSLFSLGPLLWAALFGLVALWSSIHPKDRFTWWLEVIPAFIAALALVATHKRFRLTPLAYAFILLHCAVLFVGGKYTYAEVPLFDWLRDVLHQSRNNYDKIGHFAQGFVPALVARELLIRLQVVNTGRKGWLTFLVLCIALAISALYELIEWAAAAGTGEAADAFLGTQGYAWDTQSDMRMALVGAVAAILLFSRWHDKQIAEIAARS